MRHHHIARNVTDASGSLGLYSTVRRYGFKRRIYYANITRNESASLRDHTVAFVRTRPVYRYAYGSKGPADRAAAPLVSSGDP